MTDAMLTWTLEEVKEAFRKYYEKRGDKEVPKFFQKYLSGEIGIDGKRRSRNDVNE